MATIEATISDVSPQQTGNVKLISWPALENGDDGRVYPIPGWDHLTVHVAGTLGVGGTVAIEGSNDGVNWQPLTDIHNNAMTLTALGVHRLAEYPLYVRPNVTAGDATTSLDVILVGVVPTTR